MLIFAHSGEKQHAERANKFLLRVLASVTSLTFTANKYLQLWHWFVSGNNATAVAAVTAILAFIGLWFYTAYTRRMMLVAQETRRAEIYPYLVIRGQAAGPQHVDLDLMNIGGHAAKVEGWGQTVSKQFQLASIYLERDAGVNNTFYGVILKNQTFNINILRNAATRTLMVLNCTDTRQRRHQFTILVTWNDEHGTTIVEGKMLEPPDMFPPFWRRWETRIKVWIFLKRRQERSKK